MFFKLFQVIEFCLKTVAVKFVLELYLAGTIKYFWNMVSEKRPCFLRTKQGMRKAQLSTYLSSTVLCPVVENQTLKEEEILTLYFVSYVWVKVS
jgi:hypothetical protein